MIRADFYITYKDEYLNSLHVFGVSESKREAQKKDINDFAFFLKEQIDVALAAEEDKKKKNKIKNEYEITEDTVSTYVQEMQRQKLSMATVKRRLSSNRCYARYLRIKYNVQTPEFLTPTLLFSSEKECIKKEEILTAEQVKRLLEGILKNDAYVSKKNNLPMAIPDEVRIRREPLVLRNAAIVAFFLGTGIDTVELCQLEMSDISTVYNFAMIREGKHLRNVYFNNKVSSALSDYINGLPVPSYFVDTYMFQHSEEFEWCRKNAGKRTVEEEIKEKYSSKNGYDEPFQKDMLSLVRIIRKNTGRKGLTGNRTGALFVSSRGKKISTRMVQHMVSEMMYTYLPECQCEKSVETLRKTFAAMAMEKTGGNVAAVSYQMGQKSLPECIKHATDKNGTIFRNS